MNQTCFVPGAKGTFIHQGNPQLPRQGSFQHRQNQARPLSPREQWQTENFHNDLHELHICPCRKQWKNPQKQTSIPCSPLFRPPIFRYFSRMRFLRYAPLLHHRIPKSALRPSHLITHCIIQCLLYSIDAVKPLDSPHLAAITRQKWMKPAVSFSNRPLLAPSPQRYAFSMRTLHKTDFGVAIASIKRFTVKLSLYAHPDVGKIT